MMLRQIPISWPGATRSPSFTLRRHLRCHLGMLLQTEDWQHCTTPWTVWIPPIIFLSLSIGEARAAIFAVACYGRGWTAGCVNSTLRRFLGYAKTKTTEQFRPSPGPNMACH